MASPIPGLRYDSPVAFTARQRLLLGVAAPLFAATVRLLAGTCRHETRGLDVWEKVRQGHGRAIVAVWHESTVMATHHYRNAGMHALAGYSFDAECAARAIRHLGILSVRGSSSSGGGQALRDLAVVLDNAGPVMMTVDGPRGPRRVAKPGAAILAARTGIPIVPHAFAVRPAWRLRSWDRLSIIKPFSRIVSVYAPAIAPPRNSSPFAIEETRQQVEASLNAAQRQVEAMLGMEGDASEYESGAPAYSELSSKR
jgi:lysophospholipid acyltransferase (LPLAT)-like uncharacterized protein